ncbi:MAG TPA: ABC transporter ATP-binding protein [Terriglobales bacterium]|jgi:ABC-2 type transport system ATP-binding protein|nr:ABC transporter ATP-binding protein [Terriglobales bacterium]
MLAIEILGLEKIYTVGFWQKRAKVGVRALNLEVRQGELFGFLGPNGAGKTTTLKLLMGLVFPTAGAARIMGKDWRDPAIRARIGFLPEQPYFYDHLTPTELLHYYGTLSGVSAAERRECIPKLLERVGLAEHGRTQLRKFSKGMLQRVGIAQAVVHDPEVVFLDEPMSGLDPIGRREVRDFIESLSEQGKTVFFSTHILSDAEALCDRVAVLNKGELRGVGVVAELRARNRTRVEVVWQGKSAIPAIESMGAKSHSAGDVVRATLEADQLQAALDVLKQRHAKLISVNPVGGSLEEYFLEKLNEPSAVPQ